MSLADKYPKYYKDVRHLDSVDVYAVCELFGVKDPSGATQHAIKKLLLSGVRTGGKSFEQDLREAVDTLSRRLRLLTEPGLEEAERTVVSRPAKAATRDEALEWLRNNLTSWPGVVSGDMVIDSPLGWNWIASLDSRGYRVELECSSGPEKDSVITEGHWLAVCGLGRPDAIQWLQDNLAEWPTSIHGDTPTPSGWYWRGYLEGVALHPKVNTALEPISKRDWKPNISSKREFGVASGEADPEKSYKDLSRTEMLKLLGDHFFGASSAIRPWPTGREQAMAKQLIITYKGEDTGWYWWPKTGSWVAEREGFEPITLVQVKDGIQDPAYPMPGYGPGPTRTDKDDLVVESFARKLTAGLHELKANGTLPKVWTQSVDRQVLDALANGLVTDIMLLTKSSKRGYGRFYDIALTAMLLYIRQDDPRVVGDLLKEILNRNAAQ